MSIWVKIKVTDDMKEHMRVYSEVFFKNVVEQGFLKPNDISLLIHVMLNRKEKDWFALRQSTSRYILTYGGFERALGKLVALGLIEKRKHPKDKRKVLYAYKEAERNKGM